MEVKRLKKAQALWSDTVLNVYMSILCHSEYDWIFVK